VSAQRAIFLYPQVVNFISSQLSASFTTLYHSFGVPPGKMLSSLVLATGLDLMSPSSAVALVLPEAIPARVYVSNGASLGPPPALVPATAGFGFGLLAAGALAGFAATAGFGLGLAPGGVSDGLAATAGLGFGDPPTGAVVCLSVLAGSVGCVMITSLKNG
jgi:hypothetical protein